MFDSHHPSWGMGWFGKLPSVGDFAGRGIPQSLQETVHGWTSSGMAAFMRMYPEEWRDAYQLSPVWRFVINSSIWDKSSLIGCIAPSVDRVGRCSPLMVLRPFDADNIRNVLPPKSHWLYRIDAAIRRVVTEQILVDNVFDIFEQQKDIETNCVNTADILSDLGIVDHIEPQDEWFSWPDLSVLFAERANRSFWWAEPSPKLPPKQIIHRGLPNDALFCMLMSWRPN